MNVLHFTRHYYLHHDFYLLLDTFVSRAHTLMCGTNEKWQNRMTTIHTHTQMYKFALYSSPAVFRSIYIGVCGILVKMPTLPFRHPTCEKR